MTTVIGYHGTPKMYDISEMQKPSYFSHTLDTAKAFTGDNGRVLKATITAEKVLEFEGSGASWGSIWTGIDTIDQAVWEYILKSECYDKDGNVIEEEKEYWEENGPTLNYIAEWASAQGYDLVIAHDVYDDTSNTIDTNYVVLNNSVLTMEQEFTNIH